MTAREANDAESDNSGVTRSDAQDAATDGGLWTWLVDVVTPNERTIDLSEGALYDCLSARRRRRLVRYLAGTYDDDGDTYVDVNTLAEAFARTNHEQPTSDDVRRYYISLIQTHLPVLHELELIEYYERPKKVQATEDVVLVADLMSTVSDLCEGPAWYQAAAEGGRLDD